MVWELRIARPTDNLDAIEKMYCHGLGFERLGGFIDHDGFDGVMLGHKGWGYHLEFTHQHGHRSGHAPTKDNLLVFYLPDQTMWRARCARMRNAGFLEVSACNPYWDRCGRTFEDIDGYRVVIQHAAWE